jgi:hypothetical protein
VGSAETKADAIAADFDDRKARELSHHILIADNTVSGQYWGRGISVVGGENVTIENNTIDRPSGAAVYLARETSFLTFGVRNVVVRNNRITDVMTRDPDYTVRASAARPGHGAVEIYSWLYEDEAANPRLREALAVESIRIEDNTIDRTRADGVRIGTGWGRVWPYTGRAKEGGSFTRNVTGGEVGWIGLRGNKLAGVGGQPIAINNVPTGKFTVSCENNTADGRSAAHKMCQGPPPRVEGACPL